MAEVLILAKDTGATSDMTWNRGMVVTIQPDGHAWTKNEGLPTFWRIIVTGATVADCNAYLDGVTDASGELTRLRGRKLDYSSLSTPQKRALDQQGYLTVTKAQADAYIKSVA